VPSRPPAARLLCGACSSRRRFACGFLPTSPRGDAVAVRSRGSCHRGPQRTCTSQSLPESLSRSVASVPWDAARHAWRTRTKGRLQAALLLSSVSCLSFSYWLLTSVQQCPVKRAGNSSKLLSMRSLGRDLSCFDLRSILAFGAAVCRKRWLNAHGTDPVRAVGAASPAVRVSEMRRALPWGPSHAEFLVFGPTPLLGVCAAHVSREPARHRRVSARRRRSVVSHGDSRHGLAQHAGRCERRARLADLCRLGPGADSRGPAPLCRRAVWGRPGADGLCVRLDDNRSLHVPVSGGPLQAHAARGTR